MDGASSETLASPPLLIMLIYPADRRVPWQYILTSSSFPRQIIADQDSFISNMPTINKLVIFQITLETNI